ncbi:MAG: SAM-dependent methyltransferase, partial [Salinibacter sp.]
MQIPRNHAGSHIFSWIVGALLVGVVLLPACAGDSESGKTTDGSEPRVKRPSFSEDPSAAPADTIETDVPYVPTPMPVVDRMLEMANVGPNDVVYDLGSGDGRIVIRAAEKYGARG